MIRVQGRASGALAAGVAVLMCACGGQRAALPPASAHTGAERASRAETIVEVESTALTDMVLYVVDRGRPRRLGMVATNGTERFRLSRALVSLTEPVQLIAKPIAGAAVALPQVIVRPGQRVLVSLMNHIPLSSVAVQNP